MIDDELSRLSKASLRDYSGDARLERVWRRLDRGLPPPKPQVRARLLWVPAFGIALFAAGVWVGRHGAPSVDVPPQLLAETPAASEPSRAATGTVAPGVAEEPSIAAPQPSAGRPRAAARSGSSSALAGPVDHVSGSSYGEPQVAHVQAPSEPPEWQRRADAGDFSGALAALTRSGGWEAALASASPEQLMTLVDVARASGERELAVRALRRLLDVFPGAPEAPVAAWTLGNLLDQGGDNEGSADAYALYRRLSPAGDFAEDAAARQVDAALSQKDLESAASLLDQYAKDFPNGRRLGELREELAKLTQELAVGEPAVEPAPPVAEPPVAPAP